VDFFGATSTYKIKKEAANFDGARGMERWVLVFVRERETLGYKERREELGRKDGARAKKGKDGAREEGRQKQWGKEVNNLTHSINCWSP